MGGFWKHFGFKNPLGGSMDNPFVSDLDLDSSTAHILEDFGGLLGRFLEIFFDLFWI